MLQEIRQRRTDNPFKGSLIIPAERPPYQSDDEFSTKRGTSEWEAVARGDAARAR